MKKISQVKENEAFDMLSNMIIPIQEIVSDPASKEILFSGKPDGWKFIKHLIDNHRKETKELMAAVQQVPVEEYEVRFIDLPRILWSLLFDKGLWEVFISQAQQEDLSTYGSATENIKE